MKYLPLLLLLGVAQAQVVNFGSGKSCAASTTMSLCNGFTTDNPAYSVDSILRSNNGTVTVTVNALQYKGYIPFVQDQVIQQQIGPQDGLILEHADSVQLTAATGAYLLANLKVELQQHTGGGPQIKKHYTINTYIVQSGTVTFP